MYLYNDKANVFSMAVGRGTFETCPFSVLRFVWAVDFTSVHAMKSYRGSRGITPLILNLGTGWRGEWTTSRPGRFTTGQRTVVLVEQDAGWAPEPVSMFSRKDTFLATARRRTPDC
jgi:hypothetical protein